METYPAIPIDATLEDLTKSAAYIQRLREEDVTDFNNLPQTYMLGRKVGKIPTASNDVDATDRLGDFSFALNAAYMYFFVDNAGTPEWRRVTLGSF